MVATLEHPAVALRATLAVLATTLGAPPDLCTQPQSLDPHVGVFRPTPGLLHPSIRERIAPPAKPTFGLQAASETMYRDALAHLNALRRELGHAPVELDLALTAGCERHALYCSIHGVSHHENPKSAGYSRDGARAGLQCELVTANTMRAAVSSWLHPLYHRVYMLHPELSKVGMGIVSGVAALDTVTHLGRGGFAPYAWLTDGATDVPVS